MTCRSDTALPCVRSHREIHAERATHSTDTCSNPALAQSLKVNWGRFWATADMPLTNLHMLKQSTHYKKQLANRHQVLFMESELRSMHLDLNKPDCGES